MDNDVNSNPALGSEAGVVPSATPNQEPAVNSLEDGELDLNQELDKAFSESAEESEEIEEKQGEENKTEEVDHKGQTRGEERQEELQREIRDSITELNRLKAQISEYQELQLPSVEELASYIMSQDEDISEADAIVEARMRLIEAQNSKKAQIETIAETRYEQILATENAKLAYPELFDSSNPNFNQDVASGIMQMYEEIAQVRRGDDGEVISATVRLQPFLESIGEIYRLGVLRGEHQGKARQSGNHSKKTNISYNPYPRANNTPKGDMTEDEFVESVLNS